MRFSLRFANWTHDAETLLQLFVFISVLLDIDIYGSKRVPNLLFLLRFRGWRLLCFVQQRVAGRDKHGLPLLRLFVLLSEFAVQDQLVRLRVVEVGLADAAPEEHSHIVFAHNHAVVVLARGKHSKLHWVPHQGEPSAFNLVEPHCIANKLLQLFGDFLLQVHLKFQALQRVKHNPDLLDVLNLALLDAFQANLPIVSALFQRLQIEAVLELVVKHGLEERLYLADSRDDFCVGVLLLQLGLLDKVCLALFIEILLFCQLAGVVQTEVLFELSEEIIGLFLLTLSGL